MKKGIRVLSRGGGGCWCCCAVVARRARTLATLARHSRMLDGQHPRLRRSTATECSLQQATNAG